MIRFFLLAMSGYSAFAGQDCGNLAKLSLEHAKVTQAEAVGAGGFKIPEPQADGSGLPSFCRVQVLSTPSADSRIAIEVWLPTSGWNGKLLGLGNGGFAGSINYGGLGEGIRNGYAAVSTDTGHEAGPVDAKWALNHPEKVADFGYRAIHEMTMDAKAVVQGFYGAAAKRQYFNGCSNGGRQALMEAQRYPDDYEGIVAGAPANYWTHLLGNAALNMQALLSDGNSFISPRKLQAIQAATMAACDARDGTRDGVIDNPAKCHFDPVVLECKGQESDACLTKRQVAALKQLYEGSKYFPGYEPGAEADHGAWDLWITGTTPGTSLMSGFATEYYSNIVFSNPAWDFRTFQADRDIPASDGKWASVLNSTDPDLSKFKARGGKLILYHGWNDPAISAANTVSYFGSVEQKMGKTNARQFIRLFMAPGMLHCNGGDGPSEFGQFSAGGDPEHSLGAALDRWVEKGIAVETVVATKRDAKSAVMTTRPLCAYPLIAKYKGSGSIDEAQNFSCGR